MKATITYDSFDGSKLVLCNGHKFRIDVIPGDGYCFNHQSFDCRNNLTKPERYAIREARASEYP